MTTTEDVYDLNTTQAEMNSAGAAYQIAKKGTLGAINFALIMGTLLGAGWSIWAWVR